MPKVSHAVLAALVIALLVVPASAARAAIVTQSGAVSKVPAPASVLSLASDTTMYAFDERQAVTLAAPLKVDISSPGSYQSGSSLTPTFLAAGTVVDSHLVFARHASTTGPSSQGTMNGTLTFAGDVLGIATNVQALSNSNSLGAAGTNYATGTNTYDLELGTSSIGDGVFWTAPRTVSLRSYTDNAGVDEIRVITRHNQPPVVNAGGPYAGMEGTALTLNATASDADSDALTESWSFAPTGDPGLNCTTSNTTTLHPSINCNDDATIVATLTVNDGYNAAVIKTANITIANAAPSITSITLPNPAPQDNMAFNAAFSDAGSNDTHTATIDWGDGHNSPGTVNEVMHTVSASHSYAAGGPYTVSLTLHDDNNGVDNQSVNVTINGAPSSNAGGPYSGDEGSAIHLTGTASDPENNALTTTWTFIPNLGTDAGTSCSANDASVLTPDVTCNDNGPITGELSVSDGINAPRVSDATINVANKPPLAGTASATPAVVAPNANVHVSVPFTDPGTNDTHTAEITWGDLTSSAGSVTEANGAGTASGDHSYAAAGTYLVTITITDDDGATGTATLSVHVNTPPDGSAGGPYVGTEGTQNTLVGTASDPEGDPLTTHWTFSWTGVPQGVDCQASDVDMLMPNITCNDDTTVSATLAISDGVNPIVYRYATLTVGNVAPTGGPVSVTPPTVGTNTNVHVSVPFSDGGTNDTHTATVNWGDSHSSTMIVSENLGAGTATADHTYAASGSYAISVTITDDNGGSVTINALSNVTVNNPPVVTMGGPYNGVEGSPTTVSGTITDPDSSPTFSWSFSWTGSGSGVNCTASATNTLSPQVTCSDNTLVTATLTADDHVNAPVPNATTISVANASPTVGTPVVTAFPVPVGTNTSASVSFSDPGTHDTHTATINWDDANVTAAAITETNGAGTASGTHAFSTPGIYQVSITVTDDDGGSVVKTATSYIVVFDPTMGHVTGSFNYQTPSGAYTPNDPNDPDLTGATHGGMDVQYLHTTDPVPSGSAVMRFAKGDLDFKAAGFSWLVVEPGLTKAYFRGAGLVNGVSGYDFLMSVINGSPDMVRIQVTNHVTGQVLYDLQPGAPDDASATTPITQGSIDIAP